MTLRAARVLLMPLLCAALAGCGSGPVAAPAGAKDNAHPLEVGNVSELVGTDYLVANVIGGGDGQSSSSASRSDPAVRNLLLIEKDGGAMRALLPDNRGVVDRAYFIAARAAVLLTPYDDYTQPPVGQGTPVPPAYFAIEGHAADQDKPVSVRVGAMADLKSSIVLTGLDKVLGRWMIDDHRLAVLAVRNAETQYYEIDMKTRGLLGSHALPLGKPQRE